MRTLTTIRTLMTIRTLITIRTLTAIRTITPIRTRTVLFAPLVFPGTDVLEGLRIQRTLNFCEIHGTSYNEYFQV